MFLLKALYGHHHHKAADSISPYDLMYGVPRVMMSEEHQEFNKVGIFSSQELEIWSLLSKRAAQAAHERRKE